MKCENCGAPGANIQSVGTRTLALCDGCMRRFDVQDKYELRLLQLARFLKGGDYKSALQILDSAESELGPLDADGWLKRAILSDRGMVLQEQGNWQAAFTAIEKRLQLPFDHASDRAVSLLSGALTLRRLGRMPDARTYMGLALDCLERSDPRAALPKLLRWLGEGDDDVFATRGVLIAAALRAHALTPPFEVSADPIGALRWARENWNR